MGKGYVIVAVAALYVGAVSPSQAERGSASPVMFRNVTRQAGITFRHNSGVSGKMYMP